MLLSIPSTIASLALQQKCTCRKFWIALLTLERHFRTKGVLLALELRCKSFHVVKLALERSSERQNSTKLALERRFERLNGAKLALERRFEVPQGVKLALERRFGRLGSSCRVARPEASGQNIV